MPAKQETWVQSLGWEDPLEKGNVTHSNILEFRGLHTPWGGKESDMTELLSLHSLRNKYKIPGHVPKLLLI